MTELQSIPCGAWASPLTPALAAVNAVSLAFASAVDGTKIKANASRHKAMSYARMQTSAVKVVAAKSSMLKRLVFLVDSDRLVFAG